MIGLLIVGGLVADRTLGKTGQVAVDACTWTVFSWLFFAGTRERRWVMVWCLAFATAGEAVLSLVWGLYDYQFGNLPLFVPPGHVLLFLLGQFLAKRMPARLDDVVLWLGLPWFTLSLVLGIDRLSPCLFALYVLASRSRTERRLYVTMLLLALAMELEGTWLGNWAWKHHVPWLGVRTANPPLAVGALYVVLDRLVVWGARRS